MFATAGVVLNNLHYAEVQSVNYRLFEAAGCGAVVATNALPHIDKYFSTGEELIGFVDANDLATKLRSLNASDLDEIGSRARARVAADHTLSERLNDLLSDVSE